MRHLTVAFDVDKDGRPDRYRCVRCKTQWPAATTPPPCIRGIHVPIPSLDDIYNDAWRDQ